jgi:hypothetical protein
MLEYLIARGFTNALRVELDEVNRVGLYSGDGEDVEEDLVCELTKDGQQVTLTWTCYSGKTHTVVKKLKRPAVAMMMYGEASGASEDITQFTMLLPDKTLALINWK